MKAKKRKTNLDLIKMLEMEIKTNGIGHYSSKRRTIEEMLRIRNIDLNLNKEIN